MSWWRVHPLFHAAAAALLLLLAVMWLMNGSFPLIDRWQPANTNPLRPISAGHGFAQAIVAPEDGLARVDLHLDKNNPDPDSPIVFELIEIDAEGGANLIAGETLRKVSIEPGEVNSFEMHRFVFEPVEDSGGREYLIRVSSEEEESSGLTLRASAEDVYDDGRLYVDDKELPLDLNFALFHDEGSGGLTEKVEPFRPALLNSRWLFLAAVVLAAGVFGWLLWSVAAEQRPAAAGGDDTENKPPQGEAP